MLKTAHQIHSKIQLLNHANNVIMNVQHVMDLQIKIVSLVKQIDSYSINNVSIIAQLDSSEIPKIDNVLLAMLHVKHAQELELINVQAALLLIG